MYVKGNFHSRSGYVFFVGILALVFRLDKPMIFIPRRILIHNSGGECFHLVVTKAS